MKSIVFVTSAMGRGGAERVISILAEHYRQQGWKVYIVMLWHNVVGYEINSNISVVNLSKGETISIGKVPGTIWRLRKFLKEIKPSVVVSFIYINNVVAYFATRGIKTRFIASERNDPYLEKRNFVLRKLINIAYAKSDLTIQQSERSKNYFPKKVRKNSIVVPNPIAVKEFAKENSEKIIVTAGRLVPQKNQKMLIEAFDQACLADVQYKLYIYGEGVLEEELKAEINNRGLAESVFLPGNVMDLHEKISSAYIFVLPSNFEGLSNMLLEALMMGLTCVSTNCAGSDEAIKDGENGLLIPVGDVDALKRALLKLVNDVPYGKKMGTNARISAKRYSLENVLKLWDEVIYVKEDEADC